MLDPLTASPTDTRSRSGPRPTPHLAVRDLAVRAGGRTLLTDVHLDAAPRQVLALLGPSGAGKTTLLTALNRLADLAPGLTVRGQVYLAGEPIYAPGVDVDRLRARVGMLFQQPVVFPGSIARNALFGLRHAGRAPRRTWGGRLEQALVAADLWPEVRDRLGDPAADLSVGQQQRLCLARALALEPEVLLLDEPTSALDPRSTRAIEELIAELKERLTLVLVTHDLGQARRLADRVATVGGEGGAGRVITWDDAEAAFAHAGGADPKETAP